MKGTAIITAKLTITMTNENYSPDEFDLSILKGEDSQEIVRETLKKVLEDEFADVTDGWVQTASISDVNTEIIEEQNDN